MTRQQLPTNWEDIPDGDERFNCASYDECAFCRNNQDHTPSDHARSVTAARRREIKRLEALDRRARFVYEADRD